MKHLIEQKKAGIKLILAILVVLVLANCITEYKLPPETWEETYVSAPVVIGEQVWMSENMNYQLKEKENSKCYENNQASCERLYNWTGAMSACPKGWRLPTKEDWEALSDASSFSARLGYWSSTTAEDEYPNKAYMFYMNSSGRSLEQESDYKSNFYSVRCIENANSGGGGDDDYSDDNVGCVIPTNGTCFKTDYETCLMLLGTVVGECP